MNDSDAPEMVARYLGKVRSPFEVHRFRVAKFGHSQPMLDWVEARLGKGMISTGYIPKTVPWFYDGMIIGIRDEDVAMEFRLRWC